MLNIGCHLSFSKGYLAMGKEAIGIGANTFAFFTRNPRGGTAKAADPSDAAALSELCRAGGFAPLVAHSPYTINACSSDPKIRDFARNTMADDLRRMELVPGNLYNFHPGSHTGQGAETGIAQISEMLNAVLPEANSTTVLLETMSGKGSEMGRDFLELAEIISRTELSDRLGVCLDTCHVWDAGFDIANDLDGVLTQFDREIGLSRLRAVHINDSLNDCGARKDRHAKIGEGKIGFEALSRVTNHPALKGLPFILETPNDLAGYASEIKMLRDAYKE